MTNKSFKVASSLTSHGYAVRILTWDRSKTSPETENIDGYEIHTFRFKPLFSGLFPLLLSYMAWWCCIAYFLMTRDNADIYHPENLQSFFPVIPIKILRRKKVVYDLADFLAASLNWPGPLRIFLAWLERACLRFAEGVIIIGEHRRGQIAGARVARLAVVMNCPLKTEDMPQTQKESRLFTVYYGGLLAESRGLGQICQAVQGIAGVKLIIAGFGPDEEKILSLFKGQDKIEFMGMVSSRESMELTARANLIFAFYDPVLPLNRLASPAKIFDAMMCSTPILINKEAASAAEIIEKECCGIAVPYHDIDGIINAIMRLNDKPELAMEMGRNGRKAFEREYNWSRMEKRVLELYEAVNSAGTGK